MEFRNVRDRPHDGSADSGRPDGDAPGRAGDGTARTDQPPRPGHNGQSDGPEEGGADRDGLGSSAAVATEGDAARLARSGGRTAAGDRTGSGDRSEPGRPAHLPDSPVPESGVHQSDTVTRPPKRPDRQKWVERLEQAENRTGVRDQLKERLDQLDQGHPSSLWDEDGTPREPTPPLSDYEQPLPSLTDADYQAHVEEVKKGLKEHADLATDNVHTINPDQTIWSDERVGQQDQIVHDLYASAADVPCERKAIIAGGLGGAGKTTVLEKQAGIDLSQFLTINPDKIKEELADRNMLPSIPGLTPMEASSLAHEESSYIARRLAMRAYAEGKNVIWDITMSRPSSGERVNELRNAGYQHISGVFVDIPVETSVERSNARHRRGYERYLAGQGLGGRFVPNEIILAQASPDHGSKNRAVFDGVRSKLDDWAIYDNSIEGRSAVIVEQSSR
jgi:predicted ABC-type ATPase